MPFEIVRNDIANMKVGAIVNTANPKPVIGSGTDAGIHEKAGPGLLIARKMIGPIPVGSSRITPGFRLNAKYVIHTVGPVWKDGSHGEEVLLRQCYDSALALAHQKRCESIAFPLISTGNYGFPKDRALQIAIQAFSAFLMEHEMRIYLVVFGRDAYCLSEKLFSSVSSYIDENYVAARERAEYGDNSPRRYPSKRRSVNTTQEAIRFSRVESDAYENIDHSTAMPALCLPKAASLDEMLAHTDAGFTETLLRLIDQSGKKDSQIYNRANVSRQHFSKIRNNLNYKPTKATALAFAIALELDLEQTKDLIGRAGYALTNSSKFDVIIMYFIGQRNYDMFQINATLFEFDQSLLGA